MGSPVTITPDQASEPITITPDSNSPAASRFSGSFARGMGIVSPEEGKNFFTHPLDTLKGMAQSQGDLGVRAVDEFKKGDYLGAGTHGIEYLLPGIGPTLAHAGDQLESGDTAGGIGTTLGAGTTVAAGSPEVRGAISKAMPPVVRTAGKVLNSAPVLPAVGTALGHMAGEGTAGAIIGHGARGLLSKVFGKMEKYGLPEEPPTPTPPAPEAALEAGGKPYVDPAAGLAKIPQRGAIAEQFKDPGAPLPEKPAQAFFQGRGLAEGGKPAVDPAAGLGSIPVRGSIAEKMTAPTNAEPSPIAETPAAQQSAATPPAPTPVSRGSIRQMMKSAQSSLEDGLGAVKPRVIPGKPIYQRGGIAQQMNSPTAEAPTSQPSGIPEGHTPVESSALKSYKYDSGAQEFHAQYNSGTKVHIFGDVSPQEAQAFEAAPSKGKAMALIAKHPEVARIIDGKRVTIPRRGVTSLP